MGALGSYLFGVLVLMVIVSGNFLYKSPEGDALLKGGMEDIVPFIVFLLPAVTLMAGYFLPAFVSRMMQQMPAVNGTPWRQRSDR